MKEFKDLPLVSCLCVATELSKLMRALRCFEAQTYKKKELVIVYSISSSDIDAFVGNIRNDNVIIRGLGDVDDKNLPALKVFALSVSNGEYFCDWNGDQWYHIERLKAQIDAIVQHYHPASVLTCALVYDKLNNTGYFSASVAEENTLLCSKAIGASMLSSHTTNHEVSFFKKVLSKARVFPINSPNLCVSVCQDNITISNNFSTRVLLGSKQLSAGNSELLANIVDDQYPVEVASALLGTEALLSDIDFFAHLKHRDEAI